MSYSKKAQTKNFPYKINNLILLHSDTLNDRGDPVDCKLTILTHLNKVILAAKKAFGFNVRNCKSFTNSEAQKVIYYTFVWTKMQYAVIIWYPIYRCHFNEPGHLKKRFLKYLRLMAFTDIWWLLYFATMVLFCNHWGHK